MSSGTTLRCCLREALNRATSRSNSAPRAPSIECHTRISAARMKARASIKPARAGDARHAARVYSWIGNGPHDRHPRAQRRSYRRLTRGASSRRSRRAREPRAHRSVGAAHQRHVPRASRGGARAGARLGVALARAAARSRRSTACRSPSRRTSTRGATRRRSARSPMRKRRRQGADAPASARVREAGCVILGKTTMPDFGMLSSGLSSLHGVTRNPWRLDRNPSGSSSRPAPRRWPAMRRCTSAPTSAARCACRPRIAASSRSSLRSAGCRSIRPTWGASPAR